MRTDRGRDALAVLAARIVGRAVRLRGFSATSLPGLVGERLSPGLTGRLGADLGPVALVSGTNGKTTTSLTLATLLRRAGREVVTNPSGANLGQAVTAALVARSGWSGRLGRGAAGASAVFEVDEAALPPLLDRLPVGALILTNLFRDQLDRFGETDRILRDWRPMLEAHRETPVVYCADEPRLAALVRGRAGTIAIGFGEPPMRLDASAGAVGGAGGSVSANGAPAPGSVTSDVSTCPRCAGELVTDWTAVGHLGAYHCAACDFARPSLDLIVRVAEDRGFDGQVLGLRWADEPAETLVPVRLIGLANAYNAAAALAAATALGLTRADALAALAGIAGPFGRWETIEIDGRRVVLGLVKNPVSLDEVTRAGTAAAAHVDGVLFAMNDQHADGRDVSWYWDVDPTPLVPGRTVAISGARAPDLLLRLRYQLLDDPATEIPGLLGCYERPAAGLDALLATLPRGATVLVVSTYTALLGLRAELVRRGHLDAMPV